jgi:hypothetical protein
LPVPFICPFCDFTRLLYHFTGVHYNITIILYNNIIIPVTAHYFYHEVYEGHEVNALRLLRTKFNHELPGAKLLMMGFSPVI